MVSSGVVEIFHTDHADAIVVALVADWYGKAMLRDLSLQCCKDHMQQGNYPLMLYNQKNNDICVMVKEPGTD
eukprot:2891656-Ditylum_brightwellii.AAC.1